MTHSIFKWVLTRVEKPSMWLERYPPRLRLSSVCSLSHFSSFFQLQLNRFCDGISPLLLTHHLYSSPERLSRSFPRVVKCWKSTSDNPTLCHVPCGPGPCPSTPWDVALVSSDRYVLDQVNRKIEEGHLHSALSDTLPFFMWIQIRNRNHFSSP